LDQENCEFNLPLRASWGGSRWIFLLQMTLHLFDGFGVEDEASFDNRARYVHLDGSA
jgi:hypothetical protein